MKSANPKEKLDQAIIVCPGARKWLVSVTFVPHKQNEHILDLLSLRMGSWGEKRKKFNFKKPKIFLVAPHRRPSEYSF